MRSVFLAARAFFGSARAAALAPATWISLRREMVIDVHSFSLGVSEAKTGRAAGRNKSTYRRSLQLPSEVYAKTKTRPPGSRERVPVEGSAPAGERRLADVRCAALGGRSLQLLGHLLVLLQLGHHLVEE